MTWVSDMCLKYISLKFIGLTDVVDIIYVVDWFK